MAWQPIRESPPRHVAPPRVRNVVSRSVLLLVGLLMLYGGYRSVEVGLYAFDEARRIEPRVSPPQKRISGGALPLALGAGLSLLGLLTSAAALAPVRWMERLRPSPPITGDAGQAKDVSAFDLRGPLSRWWR